MVWACAGLALTEMPSLLMATLSCLAIFYAVTITGSCWITPAALAILAGAFASLAILGRQTYLPLILIGPVVLVSRYGTKALQASILYIISCGILPGYVFMEWGGLIGRYF